MPTRLSEWSEGAMPPCPPAFNAARYCVGSAACRPAGKLALLAADPDSDVVREWSFGDLDLAVRRAAGALQAAGVGRGDRVALLLGDVPEFPLAYFGAIAAGAIATPLSSQLTPVETDDILQRIEPRAVLGGPAKLETGTAVRLGLDALSGGDPVDYAETRADDPALLVFTSGSSGQPKGVLHAQRAFWARRSMHAGWHGIGASDRVMHAGAFNWTYTLGVGLTDTWSVGGTAILNAGARVPEAWPVLAKRFAPTIFAAAPGVYRQVLKYASGVEGAFAALRHAVTAGEKLPEPVAEAWREKTGKPLLEALGMSEISTYVSTPPDRMAQPEQVGWAQPGRRIAVLDEAGQPMPIGAAGDLAVHVSDPGLMLGYWCDPDGTAAAFRGDWFITGDRVVMGEDGALRYAGRRDDQMNAGGYRVDPHEVEAALMRIAGIAECGVAEHEVRDGVRVIGAWIVPEAGAALTRDHVLAELGERLAAYKTPRVLFTLGALPKTANGKLVRRNLSGWAARELE